MRVVHGIDISNYQDPVTASDVAAWRAAHIEHVVVRCSLETADKSRITRAQLQVCQDGGMGLSVYPWAYFTADDPVRTAEAAMALVEDFQPARYWMDCEDLQYVGTTSHNIDWLHRCLDTFEAAHVPCGIYSASWWWSPHMANTGEFAAYPLGVAAYNGAMDLTTWPKFGGWSTAAWHQWAANPDLGVFDEQYIQARGEDPAVIAELQAQLAERDSTIGALRHDVCYKARLLVDGALLTHRFGTARPMLEQAVQVLMAEESAT